MQVPEVQYTRLSPRTRLILSAGLGTLRCQFRSSSGRLEACGHDPGRLGDGVVQWGGLDVAEQLGQARG